MAAEQTHERLATVTGFTSAHPGYEAGFLAAETERPDIYSPGRLFSMAHRKAGIALADGQWALSFMDGYTAWCIEAGLVSGEWGQ